MKKILANDGIIASAKKELESRGYEVIDDAVDQASLNDYINDNQIDVVLVRSATKIRKDTIDACPSLKLIGRGGVGIDNIDHQYAKEKGVTVFNTPAASSVSVAELVFAHLFGMVRYLHQSNRQMPLEGDTKFKSLKKSYSSGTELRGKTLGIIGMGRIGIEVAKISIGIGMEVITHTLEEEVTFDLELMGGHKVSYRFEPLPMQEVLKSSDFLSIHVPSLASSLITKKELGMMKKGVGIVNASRGNLIDENDLSEALSQGQVSYAGLDVFKNEPTPSVSILMNDKVSLSPHIGASTSEAQERIGAEIVENIERFFA